jgi:parvulin-like peptidyl-prolyl isomerase
MTEFDTFKGVNSTVQTLKFRVLLTASLAISIAIFGACGGNGTASNTSAGSVDPNETAATVNGKTIKMEDVERAVKQQAQGQESKLSPLELAGARLQVLQSLVEQEVMFQKAEKEGTVPTDDEVNAEVNRQKTQSGKSADQIAKEMQEAGVTEATLREQVKKALAIQKLVDKITGKIEPPKDAEIEAFYNGNKSAFVKKKGVKLAAIVIDPANSGEGDTTTDEQSAVIKGNEIIKKLQAGQDFAQVARENSEDQTRFQGGDLGYVSEEEMRQTFPAQLIQTLMSPETQIGRVLTAPMTGKLYILKLQDRSDRDEAVTLDSPGVRQQVTDQLVNSRKQLLAASYQAIAMNEAKIENYLAKKVVENPNELSGARPAPPAGSENANSNTNATTAPVNPAANTNAPAASNSTVNKPAANQPAANRPSTGATNGGNTRPAVNANPAR